MFVMELLPETGIIDATKIGRWWHKEKEIDIVALNEKTKEALFCECKWQQNVDGEKALDALKEKASHVEWKRDKEHYAVFAKSFLKKPKQSGAFFFDMKDIEKIIKRK